MKEALEELRKKSLAQVAPHLSYFNDCKPAFAISECKSWINKIFDDITHIIGCNSKVCDGCIRFDHESHLLNDEQYKLRFQICHKCIRQKTDLFEPKDNA